jgi:tetratricopeptide (TPR) repeat protein
MIRPLHRATALSLGVLILLYAGCFADEPVKIWLEGETMPTYLVDPPGLNPRFYNGRAYQGAQGRIYPYPIYESISDTRVEKTYDMVYLENEYTQICILPEIGGRLFGGLDKTNNYDFIYRQHVIKPALIGMLGSWISGGIEWNFPHHHRATAFMPVDYVMQNNPDGSATCWIGELEIRHRMKFMLGVTMYPGKSYFEITFKPFNRTPFIHSFLYFANTGVHTSEQYQVIFPPSTEFGTYHGKNQFLNWPISHEVYNRVDYTDGVDVSWWKNHPEWTSIFAWNYEDDFLAGYDHGEQAGTVCFANHHLGAGKKFWTWSTGPRGQMWDEILTEKDGPELELMIGGYSDNQPDYSWIQPYESKILRQYWYPVRELGGLKNANLDAALNLEIKPDGTAKIAFNTTSEQSGASVLLKAHDKIIFQKQIDISPAKPFAEVVPVPQNINKHDLHISLVSQQGDELIAYSPVKKKNSPVPETAKPPLPPEEIESIEQLYLTGMRLEQFYNPSFQPYPYYEEALRRDPGDYRVNVALGIMYLKRGMFEKAREHLKTAVERAAGNHTKPRDGQAYYYHGLACRFRQEIKQAYDSLYQATWSAAFHSPAFYQLAEIDCARGRYQKALAHLDRSLSTNTKNTKALNLKASIFRNLGQPEKTIDLVKSVLEFDPLDFWAANELYLANKGIGRKEKADDLLVGLKKKMHGYVQSYLELAVDYGNCGFYSDAVDILQRLDVSDGKTGDSFPMIYYYLAFYFDKKQDSENALKYYKLASQMPADYCFPFRLESIEVLKTAIDKNPSDPRAPYYLGNLLYETQPALAIEYWEKSRDLDDSFPTVHRNLGLAYYRTQKNKQKAIQRYEKAVALNSSDQRVFYELDVIYDAARTSPEKRLALLQKNHEAIAENNVCDALAREVLLLTQLGKYNEALETIDNNFFRQWEGISKAYGSFVDAHLLRGFERYKAKRYKEALKDYLAALEFPKNLNIAKPYSGGRHCQVYCFIASAYEAMGDKEKAVQAYNQAVEERQRDDLSEDHYYRALALKKIGRENDAKKIFDDLVKLGRDRIKGSATDFFAKFGEKQTHEDRLADAHYLLGLGLLGNSRDKEAKAEFAKAEALNSNHLWARIELSNLK